MPISRIALQIIFQRCFRKGRKGMRATYVGMMFIITGHLLLSGIAQAAQTITAGEIRAVIDGKYGLTSEGYAEYRRCIADTPLGDDLKEYTAKTNECKEKAKQDAYILPESKNPSMPPMSAPSLEDRAWQKEKLEKLQ
jgi:hypothetical protein